MFFSKLVKKIKLTFNLIGVHFNNTGRVNNVIRLSYRNTHSIKVTRSKFRKISEEKNGNVIFLHTEKIQHAKEGHSDLRERLKKGLTLINLLLPASLEVREEARNGARYNFVIYK